MSKKVIYLLGIFLTILIGTLLYVRFCCQCNCSAPALPSVAAGSLNAFELKGDGFNYRCSDNFNFALNDFEIKQPVGDSINLGVELLKKQLAMNPSQKLVITGLCTSQEKNNSSFPNLGFARADKIKAYLVSKGISADALDIDGKVVDALNVKDGTVFGPVGFAFKSGAAIGDTSDIKAKLEKSPLVLYFNEAQVAVSLKKEDNQTVDDIVTYLKKNPDAKLNIVGHTDNTGTHEINVKVGQRRADFAKSFFAKKIDAKQIETFSKGQDEPIADNATAQGKAKNRRAVITIK